MPKLSVLISESTAGSGDSGRIVGAASYLLTLSRGGEAPQHPHKSLVSVRGKVRGQEMTKGRMRNKRFPRSGVNVHKCS